MMVCTILSHQVTAHRGTPYVFSFLRLTISTCSPKVTCSIRVRRQSYDATGERRVTVNYK